MVDYDKLKKIPDELKQAIIKEHMKTYYHWTVGIGSFIIGTFFGILIKQDTQMILSIQYFIYKTLKKFKKKKKGNYEKYTY